MWLEPLFRGSLRFLKSAAMDIRCARLLLQAGAKINIFNNNNYNALRQNISRYRAKFPKMSMMLFAAGEAVGDTFWVREYLVKNPLYCLFPSEGRILCLMQLCRTAIRQHLLKVDPHENLFVRVPRLGMPNLLCSYLLFNVVIDGDDIDDNNDEPVSIID